MKTVGTKLGTQGFSDSAVPRKGAESSLIYTRTRILFWNSSNKKNFLVYLPLFKNFFPYRACYQRQLFLHLRQRCHPKASDIWGLLLVLTLRTLPKLLLSTSIPSHQSPIDKCSFIPMANGRPEESCKWATLEQQTEIRLLEGDNKWRCSVFASNESFTSVVLIGAEQMLAEV